MNVTTIPVGSTGMELEGVAVSTGVRESVILTSPNDPDGFAEIVSSQPINFYGLPVWVQGTPNVAIAGSVPISGTASTQIVSSIPFYVSQSSAPWTMNGAVAVTSNVTVQGTSSVNVLNTITVQGTSSVNVISSAPHALVGTSQIFGTVSSQVVSSIPFFVAQSSSPWTMNGALAVTNSPNVNVTNVPAVNITSSIPFFVAQSSAPWTVSQTASSGAKTNVTASTASKTVLAANTGRRGAVIWNDSVAQCYLDETGGTASSNSFTAVLLSQQGYVVDAGYTGAITGVWTSTAGNARVTEFT